MDRREALKAESFYDSTVEKYAEMPVETLSLEQMLHIGRNVSSDPSKVIHSAQFVLDECERVAERESWGAESEVFGRAESDKFWGAESGTFWGAEDDQFWDAVSDSFGVQRGW
eukprot:gene3362-3637_t